VSGRPLNALDRHIALVGFMGAGKTTLGRALATRLDRQFVDVDREIELRAGLPIASLFEQRGEETFRVVEARQTLEALGVEPRAVLALGGGAVTSREVRQALAAHAFTVLLDVDPDTAWARVRGSDRPLAPRPASTTSAAPSNGSARSFPATDPSRSSPTPPSWASTARARSSRSRIG
jgi:shikimate kinase